jgi:prepilin-type N-terminal cleavage/methylation domain-containing protein
MEKSKSGFTLVELLIAIVVIAIVAAISVAAYNGIQNRAKESATVAKLSDARKKILLYDVEKGQYPDADPTSITATGLAGADFTGDGVMGFQYSANNAANP